MAVRPWVTPDEVRSYSGNEGVKARSDEQLKVDILRAERTVIEYTNNKFQDFGEVPQEVKTAVIIVAESFAHNAVMKATGIKSVTYDEYSVTAATTALSLADLDIGSLLDEYVIQETPGKVNLRLRAI